MKRNQFTTLATPLKQPPATCCLPWSYHGEVSSSNWYAHSDAQLTGLAWSSTGVVALHNRHHLWGCICLCSVAEGPYRLCMQRQINTGELVSGLCFSPSAGLLSYIDHGSHWGKAAFGCVNLVRVVHAGSGRQVTATALPDSHDIDKGYTRRPSNAPLPNVAVAWSENGTQLFVCGPIWHHAGGLPLGDIERDWPVQEISFGMSGQGWLAVLANQVPSINHRVRCRSVAACVSLCLALTVLWWCPSGLLWLSVLLLASRHCSGAKWWRGACVTVAACIVSQL